MGEAAGPCWDPIVERRGPHEGWTRWFSELPPHPYRLMWGQGVQVRIPQALPSGMQLVWLGCSGCLLPQSPLLTQPFSRLACPTEPRAHVLPTLCSQDQRMITRSKVRPAHVELSGGQRLA